MNIVLRFVTKKSLQEKGIVVPNPLATSKMADAIAGSRDNIAKIYDAIREYHAWKKRQPFDLKPY